MRPVYIISHNITTPLGVTTAENFARVLDGESGIRLHNDKQLSEQPFYASLFEKDAASVKASEPHTRFEKLLIASIGDAVKRSGVDARGKRTLLIITSTKGNIELLASGERNAELYKRVALHTSAKIIAQHLGFINTPLVVSNACISGLLGILTAKRLLSAGAYDTVVVAGADLISTFILSGFQSFQAVSPDPCMPFDRDRKGITLGEGAATVILSSDEKYAGNIQVLSGGASNDANHISAPSRTGKELSCIISEALHEAKLSNEQLGFISAHGTATAYNDEMEGKALTLSGLQNVPVHSLKGFFGHTLGAAGLIESIMSVESLSQGVVLPTKNFRKADESIQLFITHQLKHTNAQYCLKTASGFGGCNAAVVFGKP